MNEFIDLVYSGKNNWWRYLISLALILFLWLIVGSVPFLLVLVVNGGMPFDWNGASGSGPLSALDPFFTFYLPVAFSFIMLFVSVFLAVKFIHNRSFLSLITTKNTVDFKRIALGFGIFILINIISTIASYLLDPTSVIIVFEPLRFLWVAPIYLALTVVQTTSEELLFRGYLLQGFGSFIKRPMIAAFLSSLLFMLVHLGNPEVSNGFVVASLYYFCVGFWLCLVTLKDKTSELAIGAHAATNMFILLVNYKTSALEFIPSIFKVNTVGELDIILSLISFVILAALVYFTLFRATVQTTRVSG